MLLRNEQIQGMHALVVDDQAHARQFLVALLRTMGLEVTAVGSGKEALKELKEKVPDIILLDAMMPRMDGFELCRRIRALYATRDTPIVFVTADTRGETAARCLSCGANEFITKQAIQAEFIQKVRTQLTLHHLQGRVKVLEAELKKKVTDGAP